MNRQIVLHLIVAAVGFFVVEVSMNFIPNMEFMRTFKELSDVRRYQMFNPALMQQEKHVFLGSCDVINNVSYTNIWHKSKVTALQRSGRAYLGQIMSYVMEEEARSDARFYDMGASATGVTEHIWYLAHLLEAGGIKTIIYANGPGGLGSFNIKHRELNLYVAVILEHWLNEYPAAAPDIQTYLDALYASDAFKELELQDPEWRASLDPDKLPASVPGSHDIWFNPFKFKQLASVRNLIVRNGSWMRKSEESAWNRLIQADIMHAAAGYDMDVHDRPLEMWSDNRYVYPDTPTLNSFYGILGSLAKANGIELVYYLEPRLHLSEEDHERFRSGVVSGMQEALEPYDVVFIDHTYDNDLNLADLYWAERKQGARYKRGHHTSAVGNYKRGRALIEALHGEGLLEPDRDFTSEHAWSPLMELPEPGFELRPWIPEDGMEGHTDQEEEE